MNISAGSLGADRDQ